MTEGDAVRSASRIGTVAGVLTVILGVLALNSPLLSGAAVATLLGVLLLLAGIAQVVFAWGELSFSSGLVSFLFGGLTAGAGIIVLTHPLFGLSSITLLLGVYFLVDGASDLVAAFHVRPEKGWGWIAFSGVLCLILGGVILGEWPVSGAWVVGTLVGIRLIFAGWSMIALGAVGRRAAGRLESAA